MGVVPFLRFSGFPGWGSKEGRVDGGLGFKSSKPEHLFIHLSASTRYKPRLSPLLYLSPMSSGLRRSYRIAKKVKTPRPSCPCPSCGDISVPNQRLPEIEIATIVSPPSPKRSKLAESSELVDSTVFVLPEPTEIIDPSPSSSPLRVSSGPIKMPHETFFGELIKAAAFPIIDDDNEDDDEELATLQQQQQHKPVTVIACAGSLPDDPIDVDMIDDDGVLTAHFSDCDCSDCEEELLRPVLIRTNTPGDEIPRVRSRFTSNKYNPIVIEDDDDDDNMDMFVKNLNAAFQAVTVY